MNSPANYEWEQLLDIDVSDLQLTPVLRPCNSHVRETTTTTQNPDVDNLEEKKPVRIIPGRAGIVQAAKLRKQSDIHEGGDESVLSTQEYIRKIVVDVGEDEDFKRGSWVNAIEYVNANGGIVSGCLGDIKKFLKNGKLDQVLAIVKSCTPNVLSGLTVSLKDLLGTIGGSIHHKVIDERAYGKDITVGVVLIHANVSVFSPKQSEHYLNITMKNVVKVFHKDTVLGNGSGVGGSASWLEEEEIRKPVEEEEMAELELQVGGNVTVEEHQLRLDEEALNLALEEEAREAGAKQEWLAKCRKKQEEDEEHERQLWGLYM